MDALPVSVVIVSRNRPRMLGRCLIAVGQLDYPVFEVIVVACPSGCTVARAAELPVDTRVVSFDQANISQARNIGLSNARGDVVAFIDDDAVPEPTWLSHLIAPFADASVAQAGGTTLGRNGISVQHAAAWVTQEGTSVPCPAPDDEPFVVPVKDRMHPRLHGTNMAMRREVLRELGGFDPRFSFYLDETDMTLRISECGGGTVHVPRAVVHHSSGPSAFRRNDRTPRRVFEIGVSAGAFHQKHTPVNEQTSARKTFLEDRRNWLLRHLQKGTLGPEEVVRLMKELTNGYDNGTKPVDPAPDWDSSAASSRIPESLCAPHDWYLVVEPGARNATVKRAIELVQSGARVTVFDYDATVRFHRVAFTEDGYWRHTGGIFGRELRTEPVFQRSSRDSRVQRTLARVRRIRSNSDLISYN